MSDSDPTLALSFGEGLTPALSGKPRFEPGSRFAGRYRVERLLGEGGMGSVFRALDEDTDSWVALKVHRLRDEGGEGAEERFRREVEILARIRIPSVPRILGCGKEGEDLYLVSELIDGDDLHILIRRNGAQSAAETARLATEVAEALAVAHDQGIVHRDVKPQNIMVEPGGKVFLVDFGLARGVGMDLKTLTRTGMIVGTPAYMSPEQCAGRDVDGRSDLYSLGIVMFEMLTGRTPFEANSPLSMAMRHASGKVPRPSSFDPSIPIWFDRIIFKCLEKKSSRRFPSARALIAELGRARSGRSFEKKALANGWELLLGHPDWSLVVSTPDRNERWQRGMALQFEERFLRLDRIQEVGRHWEYRFGRWPEGEIFRKLVDFEQEVLSAGSEGKASLGSLFKGWLKGGR